MVPAEAIEQAGTTVEEFIGSLEEVRRREIMWWNPITSVHHMTSDFSALEPSALEPQ